ncbi:beta-lactamase family protein [Flagellimonas sp. 389]|uniref:serine hydrolase domain-containing protein n=1 Tax=Flagellimonas sp. 389 TaxID=2835862 RepID=UPI001BD4437E|nr:serine hydrolase domain-containing protein [uncultured Allomuricauda sp.]MBS9464139.1 beta-lactamase family protein [Flagellimonas sp. 389]
MGRIKVLGISALVVIMLFVIGAGNKAEETVYNGYTNDNDTLEHRTVTEKEKQLYYLQQQKLKIALQDYFKRAIASGDVVGTGISIVHGDSILFSGGFGKRSIEGKARIDEKTIFRLGSLSKGFAGVLASSLQAEGKLDWNDKVVDYIPEFQFGDSSNTQKVRLCHILSHTSGTPYHSYTNLVEAGLPVANIAKRFNEVTPISEPGTMYSYQNAMFSLSQEIMRKVTGKDIQALLQNRFFKPLGMATISMDHNTLLSTKNVAFPHAKRKNGWKSLPLKDRYYNAIVAGGINASATDMGKWMHFLLGHNPEVLSSESIQAAFRPFIKIGNNNKYYQRWPNHAASHYGFGWRVHTLNEVGSSKTKTVWHHGGSVNDYRNEIALYPDNDLGICVLFNGNSKLARTVIPDLYKIVETVYAETEHSEQSSM